MTATTPLREQLSSLEPSFRAESDVGGSFQLDGRRAWLWLEPEGWIVGSLPVAGAPFDLLRQQPKLISPAKVASGPSLRAEMPVRKEIKGSCGVVRSALEHGLEVLAGKNGSAPTQTTNAEEAASALAEYLASSSWDWTREAESFLLRVESGVSSRKIGVEVANGHVLFQSELVTLRDPDPVSGRALAHFLLALNGRLRLARGSLFEDRVALEVVVPAAELSSWLIDKTLGSLIVGARLAKRECAALLDAEVAQTYCAFHEEGR